MKTRVVITESIGIRLPKGQIFHEILEQTRLDKQVLPELIGSILAS
jgi:hypothetical protein